MSLARGGAVRAFTDGGAGREMVGLSAVTGEKNDWVRKLF